MEKLAVREVGQGETIVFVHGTPTCSYEYREVFDLLSDKYRCVAVDHLGFGDSPKPRDGDYRLIAHQERLKTTLINQGIRKFHLVVHDFGGVIGLPILWDSRFEVMTLTLLNTWAWPLIETEPQMKIQRWLASSGILEFLYRNLNFSPRILLKMAWGKKVPLDPSLHQYYINRFPTASDRSGTIAFMHALFDTKNPVWRMSSEISNIKQPVLIIWGIADKLISTRNLERWHKLLPQAKCHELSDVGHFIAEEAPKDFVDYFKAFITGSKSE